MLKTDKITAIRNRRITLKIGTHPGFNSSYKWGNEHLPLNPYTLNTNWDHQPLFGLMNYPFPYTKNKITRINAL